MEKFFLFVIIFHNITVFTITVFHVFICHLFQSHFKASLLWSDHIIFPHRMLGRRDEETSEPMIDVTYSQSVDERSVVAVLQKLYLCASVEFLLAVADFFVQALPTSPPTQRDKFNQLPLKYVSEPKIQSEPKAGMNAAAKRMVVSHI